MNRVTFGLLAILAAGAAIPQSGCMAGVGLYADTYPGQLVEISPGVWVVSSYSQPVFYNSGSYWWWNGSGWYSSRYVDDRYRSVRYSSVPPYVRQIQQPRNYIHYALPPQAPARPIPPGHIRQQYPNPGGGPRPGGPGGPRGPGGPGRGR